MSMQFKIDAQKPTDFVLIQFRAEYDEIYFFFSSRRRHTRCSRDWNSDVCSSDLPSPSGEIFGLEADVEVESRMNRATLDYIRCQGLWNKDGQVAALGEINARRREEIQFPYGATEVKDRKSVV